MNRIVYIVPVNPIAHTDAVEYLVDTMTGYDVDLYRYRINVAGLNQTVALEWSHWIDTCDSDYLFVNRKNADAHAADANSAVITVTPDDMQAALMRLVAE